MRKLLRFLGVVVISAAFVCSCSRDVAIDEVLGEMSAGTSGDVEIGQFSFVVDDFEGSDGATRSVVDGMSAIKNMWAVQFDSGGTYTGSQYVGSFTSTDGIEIYDATTTIVFIANTFNTNLITPSNCANLNALKALTKDVTANNSILGTDSDGTQYTMMSGAIENYDKSVGGSTVTLKRNCVKVKVILSDTSGEFITRDRYIAKVETLNINKSYYYTNYSGFSPSTNDVTESYIWSDDEVAYAQTDAGYTFFLPANKAGTVSSNSTSSDKTQNAPQDATAIRITFGSTDSYWADYLVYTFYLGENSTTDYNLQHNHSYEYTFNITGIDDSDARCDTSDWYSFFPYGTDVNDQLFGYFMIRREPDSEVYIYTEISYVFEIGYTSDFLPSRYELMAMWIFSKDSDEFTSDYYWSCSYCIDDYIWCVHFGNGATDGDNYGKWTSQCCVRPVKRL